jgi:uncharacterized membrane protein YfcA
MLMSYAIGGLMVGFLVGLTGIGGGSLMTPLLILLFGVSPATAVGTDLLYASITKSIGAGIHGWRGQIDWRIVFLLGCGSIPSAIASLGLVHYLALDAKQLANLINTVLGIALLLTALSLAFKNRLMYWVEGVGAVRHLEHNHAPLTIISGALVGIVVALSSVGAGAIGTMILFMLYPRLQTSRIVGSDITHAIFLTTVAGAGHLWLGSVNMNLLANLLVGSIPGVIAGSLLCSRLPEPLLRGALATLLLLVGSRMLMQ